MSVDLATLVNYAVNTVVIAILVLGIFRARELRRSFVNSTYRSRATWSAILMLFILLADLNNYVPANAGLLAAIGVIPFIAVLLVTFAFVDRTVLVAIEADFFHRNTLRWLQVRRPAGIILVAVLVILALGSVTSLPAFNGFPPPPDYPVWGLLAIYSFLVVLPGILAYSSAALIIGARRTSDRSLKRNILLLGLALSTLLLSLVATLPFDQNTLPYVIINQGTSLVGIYLIYKSVMSLSPLGKLEPNNDTIMIGTPRPDRVEMNRRKGA